MIWIIALLCLVAVIVFAATSRLRMQARLIIALATLTVPLLAMLALLIAVGDRPTGGDVNVDISESGP